MKLIIVGPVPPPFHGVTISTALVLKNPELRKHFDVEHLDTSDRRTWHNLGRWDLRNMVLGAFAIARLTLRLRGAPGLVYVQLSQGRAGFLRDSLLIALASRRGWKVVGHLRGGEFRAFHQNQPRVVRRWIELTLGRLSSVAVLGESLRSEFDGLMPAEKVAVVPNGTPSRAAPGTQPERPVVLFLSNLRRRKGVVEALEAALLVVREDRTARFVFVGDWEDRQLEQALKARAPEVGDRIEFRSAALGAAKDTVMASSSLLLFPPIEPEGHPRVVLEALAAGLPVVTTDQGAIAETVIDGECGFVLDHARPEELAERMLRLVRDPRLLERMRNAARARYEACFTQERSDRQLAEWLEQVARGVEPPGRSTSG